ncbi:TetR family transcriptional regulator [Ectopseudomonas oleovorans]|uniref:TetR family transcriptional regulator n=1 Tax=Ectopseudomonas oleovorans TaxID=301 RepID=A0A3D9E7W3_ECTOL|nr:TetR family transcriptional regulator [Pseudomonas oleovorans]
MSETPRNARRTRSDALQNRERILSVALEELTQCAEIPLSAIAKKAGVGQGTFYRHFATREALVLEVYRYEMLQVADYAVQLLDTVSPDKALRTWMSRLAEYAVNKAGLAKAMRDVSGLGNCVVKETYAPVTAAAQILIDANVKAGIIREGITADDFFLALAGIWHAQFDTVDDRQLVWLLDFVMDGMRVKGAGEPIDT